MTAIKKIGTRILIIFLMLIAFNFIYQSFFLNSDINKEAAIIHLLPTPADSAQILYFAESSNFTYHRFDEDKRSISEMFAEYYPDKKVATINKGALHAGIYKTLLQNISSDNQIETVIITLNLRSFGAGWIYSKLETSLQKSTILLQNRIPIINRIILSFKGYDIKTDKEREKQVIKHWKKDQLNFPYKFEYKNANEWEKGQNKIGYWNADESKNYEKTALACHYIKSYGFDIDSDKNPRIKDFDEIVSICKDRNWKVVFNLMAENTEKGNELVGDDLIFLMKRNRDFLINRYQTKNVIVVDNLDNVATQYFIDQNWTTEHYTEEGRQIIAMNLADSLKTIYSNKYRKVIIPSIEKASRFFNNCEGEVKWKNNSTLTNEMAYEGVFSSKIDTHQPYSVTLEKPLKYIPDSTKNSLYLSINAYQTSFNNEASAVFELQGDYIKTKWIVVPFQMNEINQWEKLEFKFSLSNIKLNDYNFFKIYCSNKNGSPVYIDNWEVIFE